jgi:hypothetical protein
MLLPAAGEQPHQRIEQGANGVEVRCDRRAHRNRRVDADRIFGWVDRGLGRQGPIVEAASIGAPTLVPEIRLP